VLQVILLLILCPALAAAQSAPAFPVPVHPSEGQAAKDGAELPEQNQSGPSPLKEQEIKNQADPATSDALQRFSLGFIKDAAGEQTGFHWGPALRQSFYFLSVEHGFRMFQGKTRREFRGPFFKDYLKSIQGIQGWGDGDPVYTNYIAHPMQGAVSGFFQIQNDPRGVTQQLDGSKAYWHSRLKAFAWSAAYSTQFEVGLYSEAMFGNVGMKKGTGGYVDLVMTPVGGLGLIVAEDALDRFVIRRLEGRSSSKNAQRFYRAALNPSRSIANLFRLKKPWYRDSRPLDSGPLEESSNGKAVTPSHD
jgi:hypothetical protein